MGRVGVQRWVGWAAFTVVIAACGSCGSPPAPAPVAYVVPDARVYAPGDKTVMFIEIIGTKDQIAPLYGINGLEVQGRREDVGGGRIRVVAMLTERPILDELRAKGLTVNITKSEEESQRAVQRDMDMMRAAHEAEDAAKRGGSGSSGSSSK